jgi:AcrR family transcriptional regulator
MPVPPPPKSPRKAHHPASGKAAEGKTDRRMAILLAAEKLFSQHGYHAVGLRSIAEEAGVPLALIGYYFGPKAQIFDAIFERWSDTTAARLSRLKEIAPGTRRADKVERIVHAFVEPVLEMRASAEGEYYATLVARELTYHTPEARQALEDYFDPLANAFIDALQAAHPGHDRGQAAWAYQFALGALLHHLTDVRVQRLSGDINTPNDPAAASHLIRFISAGISAVMGPASKPGSG